MAARRERRATAGRSAPRSKQLGPFGSQRKRRVPRTRAKVKGGAVALTRFLTCMTPHPPALSITLSTSDSGSSTVRAPHEPAAPAARRARGRTSGGPSTASSGWARPDVARPSSHACCLVWSRRLPRTCGSREHDTVKYGSAPVSGPARTAQQVRGPRLRAREGATTDASPRSRRAARRRCEPTPAGLGAGRLQLASAIAQP